MTTVSDFYIMGVRCVIIRGKVKMKNTFGEKSGNPIKQPVTKERQNGQITGVMLR